MSLSTSPVPSVATTANTPVREVFGFFDPLEGESGKMERTIVARA